MYVGLFTVRVVRDTVKPMIPTGGCKASGVTAHDADETMKNNLSGAM